MMKWHKGPEQNAPCKVYYSKERAKHMHFQCRGLQLGEWFMYTRSSRMERRGLQKREREVNVNEVPEGSVGVYNRRERVTYMEFQTEA